MNVALPSPPRHLLVPVALGVEERAASEVLVDAAVALALALNARLTLLHVAPPIETGMAPAATSTPPPGYQQMLDVVTGTRAALQDALTTLGARAAMAGAAAELALVERDGNVADVVVAVAAERGADLIVLTSHSRHGLQKLLLGSVAERTASHATVPVMIIPHRAQRS